MRTATAIIVILASASMAGCAGEVPTGNNSEGQDTWLIFPDGGIGTDLDTTAQDGAPAGDSIGSGDTIGFGDTQIPGCVPSGAEDCSNSKDDDCDGKTDAQDTDCQQCVPGTTQPCTTGHPGACAQGYQKCVQAGGTWEWEACQPSVKVGSQPEDCSGTEDKDCDGKLPAADPDCQCSNKTLDGNESDVDCGGSCPPCGAGKLCTSDADCQSKVCQGPTASGGCQVGETLNKIYTQSGKLYVTCESDWFGNTSQTKREIIISGVTVSGGCQMGEDTKKIYTQSGKLYVTCESDWFGNTSQTKREITLSGADSCQ